ncbi:helix-turn-helix transcriptional regulator [Actinoplanes palleronii]|uniref:Transcriptional regulator n=1 Tax=Actinoplanes palleronii TaxID=113570 RepID=A0ABQ4BSQ8_9ACTN|nr:WYL domain-containing protein [Actinoplanes palleronii]GIE73225.1 transcriptional regulator [Actinoplanes palleronii]
MTRPTARVLTLLELLQSGGVRTLADLSDRLGVDRRTVRRYIQHLIDLDVPVESVRGRYGGYRVARGHRLPPLMLAEDEALAVLLSLSGLTSGTGTAGETAAAKLRRVLPAPLQLRLDAVLVTAATTAPSAPPPDAAILLPLAAAIRTHQPIRLTYATPAAATTPGAPGTPNSPGTPGSPDSTGSPGSPGLFRERALHPYGLVVHSGRWYVIGLDPAVGEERTLRLDRIGQVRAVPGSFEPPTDFDPAERLVTGFATANYRYDVRLRIQATTAQIRTRLPATVATIHESPGPWLRVDIRAESLTWIPGVLASLDHPFVVDQPAELRTQITALATRLTASANRPEP